MSGGSYEYAYRYVEEFAARLESQQTCYREWIDVSEATIEKRLAFAVHLWKVAAAMKAIEWVESGDCSEPHDADAIDVVLPPAEAGDKSRTIDGTRETVAGEQNNSGNSVGNRVSSRKP